MLLNFAPLLHAYLYNVHPRFTTTVTVTYHLEPWCN